MPREQQPNHYEHLLSDATLLQCWNVVKSGSHDQYMQEVKIKQWINRVIAEKGLTERLADVDLDEQLSIYMKNVHELDRSTITNVMFKFEEAVEFYGWLVRDLDNELQPQTENENQFENQQQAQYQDVKQQPEMKASFKQEKQDRHHKSPTGKNKTQQEDYMYPAARNHNKMEDQNQNKKQDEEANEDQNQFAQTENDNVEQKNEQGKISKNHREYLNVIFDHYCRINYATGSDPTFEQIQQKTQVMTINKFMIFCKDFGILKLNNMNRNTLVEMFKKNSQFYKEMNFEQFMDVLIKISSLVYSPDNEENPSETSKQFEQLLLFLQVNNLKAFKKKMATLNIPYRVRGGNKQNTKPNQYKQVKAKINRTKFNPGAVNGKTEQQVKEELQTRKRIRSENKLQIMQKILPKNDSMKKHTSSNKHMPKSSQIQRSIAQKPQIKSVNVPKKLAPPLPPARKISNLVKPKLQIVQETGVTGYANIHRLKQMEKQGGIQSKLKLNSIVQQAKKMMLVERNEIQTDYGPSNRASTYGRQTPYSDFRVDQYYDRDMNQSEQSNYSQREIGSIGSYGNIAQKRTYVPHGHSQLEKKNKIASNQELKGIIDDDSDHDEFLQEHLNREKKTGHMNKRIENKIKQFELREAN